MEILHSSNCNRIHGSIANPFFLDPQLEKRNKKKVHQSQIIEIYRHWINDDLPLGFDHINFDIRLLRITLIGGALPRYPEQTEFYTNEERALVHLNCKEYRRIFVIYDEIRRQQDTHNRFVNTFLHDNRHNIQRIQILPTTIPRNTITRFQNNLDSINQLIEEFRGLLRRVIDNDLKGACPIEEQTIWFRFKSFFNRNKHSESE
jgi:hypothetical protein